MHADGAKVPMVQIDNSPVASIVLAIGPEPYGALTQGRARDDGGVWGWMMRLLTTR